MRPTTRAQRGVHPSTFRYRGVTYTSLADLARVTGVALQLLIKRIVILEWPVARAVEHPVRRWEPVE